jgi:proline iminopeptidase
MNRSVGRTLFLLLVAGTLGCERQAAPNGGRPAASPPSGPSLSAYFAPETAGVDAAGVRLIPIQTPKGTFKVWTKRFGRNPRIKLLLLHGGPGATHEYFEGLETFLRGAASSPPSTPSSTNSTSRGSSSRT